MEDTLNAQDVHTKASRETIMRLVSEIGKEQKSVTEVNEKARSLEEVSGVFVSLLVKLTIV